MGNKQYIQLNKKNDKYKESLLCNLVGEGNVASLIFQDGNYEQQMRDSKFLQFLDKYSQNKIKLITTIGEGGQGKSLIQNFILQNYQNREEYLQIFRSSNTSKKEGCTKGIKFYFPQNLKKPEDQKEDILVFFDCEGFDYSNYSSHQQNLMKLICLISRLSTCLLFVTTNPRQKEGFNKLLQLLNPEGSNNQAPHQNFIHIFNKWSGQNFVLEGQHFKKQFKLKNLNIDKKQIKVDENYFDFINEIEALHKYCIQSKYSTTQSGCKAFEREQTCKSFKEMLTCFFQIIEKEMTFTSEQYFELINKQLELKQDHAKAMKSIREFMKQNYDVLVKTLNKNEGSSYKSEIMYYIFNLSFQNYYSEKVRLEFDRAYKDWYNKFQQEFKRMYQISMERRGRVLDQSEQNQILQVYQNLDSIKPFEIKEYERQNFKANNDEENTRNVFATSLVLYASSLSVLVGGEILAAEGIIMMVGVRTLFFSLGFAFASLIGMLQFLHYVVKNQSKKSLSNTIKNGLFNSIRENKFSKCYQNNLKEIKNILVSKIPNFNQYTQFITSEQEREAVSLLLLMNMISKPFDKESLEKQKTDSYLIDIQLFQSAIILAQQFNFNSYSNIEKLQFTDSPIINDKDFHLSKEQNKIQFRNYDHFMWYRHLFSNVSEQEDQFYQILVILKCRNEDLFLKFILQIFFGVYISEMKFSKLVIENQIIEKTMQVQNKVFG